MQHPTFHYDLRGQGKLVLTRPFDRGGERALLEFPRERNYLLLRDHEGGAVLTCRVAPSVSATTASPTAPFIEPAPLQISGPVRSECWLADCLTE